MTNPPSELKGKFLTEFEAKQGLASPLPQVSLNDEAVLVLVQPG